MTRPVNVCRAPGCGVWIQDGLRYCTAHRVAPGAARPSVPGPPKPRENSGPPVSPPAKRLPSGATSCVGAHGQGCPHGAYVERPTKQRKRCPRCQAQFEDQLSPMGKRKLPLRVPAGLRSGKR